MPEKINRVVTDSITTWFFTTSETANANLRRSGVTDDRIFFVGNTMVDTLLKQMSRLRPPTFWGELGLQPDRYFVVTLHRPANVDGEQQLLRLLPMRLPRARVACRWCSRCIRAPQRICVSCKGRYPVCTMSIRRATWNSTTW